MDPYKYRPSSAFNSPFWTANSGAPVWNNNSSLTIGTRVGGERFPVKDTTFTKIHYNFYQDVSSFGELVVDEGVEPGTVECLEKVTHETLPRIFSPEAQEYTVLPCRG